MSSLANPAAFARAGLSDGRPERWSVRMADSTLRRYPASAMRWRYEDGFLLKAIEEAGRQAGAPRHWQAVMDYVQHCVQPDGSIGAYRVSEYSLDQVMPGRLLLPVYRATADERYLKAIATLLEQLRWQPRTRDGGFWHKLIYPYQMWLDGIYMACPFLAEYAAVFEQPGLFDEVAHQIVLMEQRVRDHHTGLLYHAWDESCQQAWCRPDSGCSPQFWGRAIGWYVAAIVDVLDYLPPGHPQVAPVSAILERTLTALLDVRDPDTGLWRQVLDQGPRPGNYLEASSACMYVYALAKGVRQGYLPAGWRAIADECYRQILEHFIEVDPAGEVALHWTCGTAGLGGAPYRDGSYEYYASERVVTNDTKGVAAFVLASLEIERPGP